MKRLQKINGYEQLLSQIMRASQAQTSIALQVFVNVFSNLW